MARTFSVLYSCRIKYPFAAADNFTHFFCTSSGKVCNNVHEKQTSLSELVPETSLCKPILYFTSPPPPLTATLQNKSYVPNTAAMTCYTTTTAWCACLLPSSCHYQTILLGDSGTRGYCEAILDSAVAGIQPVISNCKSNILYTTLWSHVLVPAVL